jgi:hypothetical protein
MLPAGVLGIVGRVGIGGIGESIRGMFDNGDKGEGCCSIDEEVIDEDDADEAEDRVNESMFLSPSRSLLGWRLCVAEASSVDDLFSATVAVGIVNDLAESTAGSESVLISRDVYSLSLAFSFSSLLLLFSLWLSLSFCRASLPLAILLRSLTLFFDMSVNGMGLRSSANHTAEKAP